MSELIKRSEDWLDYHKGAPWETDAMKLIAELVKRAKELEQQLATAHRAGWEQCQMEAKRLILDNFACSDYPRCDHDWCGSLVEITDTIASMEYKEPTNG